MHWRTQDLADERRQQRHAADTGRDAAATHKLAIDHVANVLAQPNITPDDLVLQHLPWLLHAAPQHASALLQV